MSTSYTIFEELFSIGERTGNIIFKNDNEELSIHVKLDGSYDMKSYKNGIVTYKYRKNRHHYECINLTALGKRREIERKRDARMTRKNGEARTLGQGKTGILRGKQERITCPYCGLTGGLTPLKRYHFEKCKYYDKSIDVNIK